jgi:hypothetical protein
MFGGAFSLTKFSLRVSHDSDFNIKMEFEENVTSMITFSSNLPMGINFREAISNVSILTRGYPMKNNYREYYKAVIQLRANDPISQNYREAIQNRIQISSNLQVAFIGNEAIQNRSSFVKNFSVVSNMQELIYINALLSKNVYIRNVYSEDILAIVTSRIIDHDRISINVTIPPGGELRIDSDNYTVTLNGQNIIAQQSGDWIWLTRNVISMQVSTNMPSNPLSGQLLYTEKYL